MYRALRTSTAAARPRHEAARALTTASSLLSRTPSLSPLPASIASGLQHARTLTHTSPASLLALRPSASLCPARPSSRTPVSSLLSLSSASSSSRSTSPSALFSAAPANPSTSTTATTAASSSSSSSAPHENIRFDNPEVAFRFKSTLDIVKSLIVFKLLSYQTLVRNSQRLIDLCKKVLGEALTYAIIKRTFFSHFCAGETGVDIRPTVNKLLHFGVGSILDYAAEADITDNKDPTPHARSAPEVTGRVHPEDIEEEECDKNMQIILDCIAAAAQFDQGFAAVKVTALGRPQTLEKMTIILTKIRDLFNKFDNNGSRQLNFDQFSAGIDGLGVSLSAEKKRELFDSFDKDRTGFIDFLEWTEYLRVEDLRTRPFFTEANRQSPLDADGNPTGNPVLPCLNNEELHHCDNMMNRLYTIAEAAAKHKVRLMIDAEQTYFQAAISHSVVNLQRKYNREFPVIFNTYQSYLRDSTQQVEDDIARSTKEKFWFAGKIVRGAYMTSERKRAAEKGYADPIWSTIEETHACYHRNLELIMRQLNHANVMVASHNEETVRRATQLMAQYKLDKKRGGVFFGQLLGMSDHLTLTLGQAGYAAYKYVPYGPVKAVIPYLLRRAEENSSLVVGGATETERRLLFKELRRRLGF